MVPSTKVVVIADRGNPVKHGGPSTSHLPQTISSDSGTGKSPHRKCLWSKDDRHPSRRKVEIRQVSIAEYPPSIDIFSDADLIVFNWDSLNGDSLYRSEETLNYFSYSSGRLREFVNNGGVVFIERQTARNRSVQRSYDAVLGQPNQVIVSQNSFDPDEGMEIYTARGTTRDPLASVARETGFASLSLGNDDPEYYDLFVDVPPAFIPDASNGPPSPNPGKRRLWSGYFELWGRDWLPLYVNGQGFPVVLSKRIGEGMVFATTIWPSYANKDIAARVLEISRKSNELECAIDVYNKKVRRRSYADGVILIPLIGANLGAAYGLVYLAQSDANAWLLSVGGIGMFTVLQLSTAWYKGIWRRPLGVSWLLAGTRRASRVSRRSGVRA